MYSIKMPCDCTCSILYWCTFQLKTDSSIFDCAKVQLLQVYFKYLDLYCSKITQSSAIVTLKHILGSRVICHVNRFSYYILTIILSIITILQFGKLVTNCYELWRWNPFFVKYSQVQVTQTQWWRIIFVSVDEYAWMCRENTLQIL